MTDAEVPQVNWSRGVRSETYTINFLKLAKLLMKPGWNTSANAVSALGFSMRVSTRWEIGTADGERDVSIRTTHAGHISIEQLIEVPAWLAELVRQATPPGVKC